MPDAATAPIPSTPRTGPAAGPSCLASGTPLAPETPVIAVLCEPAEGERAGQGLLGLVRGVVERGAWDGGFRPPRLVCFWRTVVPAPSTRTMPLDEGALLEMLERASEAGPGEITPRQASLHFIVALVLLRRRRVRLCERRREIADGTERWVFEAKGADGEAWRIELPAATLAPSELAEAAEALGDLLGVAGRADAADAPAKASGDASS